MSFIVSFIVRGFANVHPDVYNFLFAQKISGTKNYNCVCKKRSIVTFYNVMTVRDGKLLLTYLLPKFRSSLKFTVSRTYVT